MSEAYLLVSHGSRDPRPEVAMEKLAINLGNKLESSNIAFFTSMERRKTSALSPDTPLLDKERGRGEVQSGLLSPTKCDYLIGTGYLELHPQSLNEQIVDFSRKAITNGIRRLKILPLFLLPGIHVTEDIPQQVELAKQTLGEDISIELQPHLGSYFGLQRLLAKNINETSLDGRIIIAHGSRRVEANNSIEAMAISLNAVAAYWAISPNLQDIVTQLVTDGKKKIGILPYFLFSGGITDAIAQSIQDLKLRFPMVSFQLYEPLEANEELIDLIWNLMHK